jgi:uncharacterized DUF497 family protein
MDVPREFEWDPNKARANIAKHDVHFAFATRVFDDPDRVEIDSSRAQDAERRAKIVGLVDGLLYVAVVTYRGAACRIISARRTNATEERLYGTR